MISNWYILCMRHYRAYTEKDIIDKAKQVSSLSQLLKQLGLRAAGGNYDSIKTKLCKYKVDCCHWTGKGWNKDKRLKDWSEYTRPVHLKKHLVLKRGHKCELCALELWLDKPIMLELHHVDGDRTNNNPENISLLCPNCHSTTDNFRGRKNWKIPTGTYVDVCLPEATLQV